MAARDGSPAGAVAKNRKARHDYFIDDRFEAGIVLAGTEVKSLREGRGNIAESYAGECDGEIYLFNAYIPEYQNASHFSHETRRPRKLLLKRREIDKLIAALIQKGVTLVPLAIYFNARGIAKVEIGVATGKRKFEKREAIKERDWRRQKARLMRDKG